MKVQFRNIRLKELTARDKRDWLRTEKQKTPRKTTVREVPVPLFQQAANAGQREVGREKGYKAARRN